MILINGSIILYTSDVTQLKEKQIDDIFFFFFYLYLCSQNGRKILCETFSRQIKPNLYKCMLFSYGIVASTLESLHSFTFAQLAKEL